MLDDAIQLFYSSSFDKVLFFHNFYPAVYLDSESSFIKNKETLS